MSLGLRSDPTDIGVARNGRLRVLDGGTDGFPWACVNKAYVFLPRDLLYQVVGVVRSGFGVMTKFFEGCGCLQNQK